MHDFKCVGLPVFHSVFLRKISEKFGVWVGSRLIWLRLASSDGQHDNVWIPSQVRYVFTMSMITCLQEEVC